MMRAVRSWGWETAVFRGATGVCLLHALDDAFANRQPGVDLGQHALAAALSLVLGLAAIVAFPRLRPGLRAALSLAFGVLAAVNGALHLRHVTLETPEASDYTGVLALLAGVALIGLGVAIPFLHRGEGARTRARRWAYRVVAVLGSLLVAYVLVLPTSLALVVTHKYREPIGEPPDATYEPVTFESSDGLELAGWYRRSENRAAVLVVHGGGGDRNGTVRHAELLARHGYGVLVYDARGRGESEGSPVSVGWGWSKDVAGALAFLRERPEIDRERLGGLGLSTGADVLIDVAAEDRGLRALVSDGATAASFADYRKLDGLDEAAPFYLTMYTAIRVLSGESPGRPLEELVAEVSPTPLLLVSTGGSVPTEIDFNRIYAEAAREPVEHWELPEVRHNAAVSERPAEYERRVIGFFDDALLDRRGR
jgi:alpha/beta superfamily hydrolase